jgi:hypothetical protein
MESPVVDPFTVVSDPSSCSMKRKWEGNIVV